RATRAGPDRTWCALLRGEASVRRPGNGRRHCCASCGRWADRSRRVQIPSPGYPAARPPAPRQPSAAHGDCHLARLAAAARVVTVSERRLLVETGVNGDGEELLTASDPFYVEDIAFLNAVSSANPNTVVCSYADGLRSHRLAWQLRAATEIQNSA